MRSIVKAVSVAVLAVAFAGCASQMAMFAGSSKKTVSVKGSLDAAFAAAVAAGNDLQYKVTEKKASNLVYSSRGYGYSEMSTVMVRFREEGGKVYADFDANSSKGSQTALDEYFGAFTKHAQVE